MKYFKWFVSVPMMCILFLATFPLAFILPFFAQKRQGFLDNNTNYGTGYYLPTWLSWFQTPDNSIDGDKGWREEHWQWRFKLPFSTYIGRVGWLWRNNAYGFGLVKLQTPCHYTTSGNMNVSADPFVEGKFFIETDEYWQLRYVKRWFGSFGIYANFGWNIKGALEDNQVKSNTCTFAFSPRPIKIK